MNILLSMNNIKQMLNKKLLNIHTSLYDEDLKLNEYERDNLYDQVEKLQIFNIESTSNILQNIKDDLDGKIKELDENKKVIKFVPIISKCIHQIRQMLNKIMNKLWDENYDKLKDKDYIQMANSTHILRRKDINDKNGCKFALAILNDIDSSIIFSKKLCELYIKLNDMYHPPTKPIERILLSTQMLRDIIKDCPNLISDMFDINISNDTLDILDNTINENKTILQ